MAVNISMLAGAGAQFFDNSGIPLAGGLFYTYDAGTTTPQVAYTTSAGTIAHTNPIVLDSAGRVASGGEIWLSDAIAYKFVLKTPASVTIGTYDNVTGNSSGIYAAFAASTGSALIGYLPSGTGAIATTVQSKLRESVSVLDFGADPTGASDSTTAIQNAVNTARKVLFPKGTYLTGAINIPSNTALIGEATADVIIQANGAIVASGLFNSISASFVEIANFTFSSTYPSYSTLNTIFISESSFCHIHDIKINSANIGLTVYNSADSIFERINVINSYTIGMYITGVTSFRNKVLNCTVTNVTVQHCIQIQGGQLTQVSGCTCSAAGIFGISIYGTYGAIVTNNVIYDTTREGINLEGANNCIVTNNQISWSGPSISADFGLSLYGATPSEYCNFNVISNNQIEASGKSGIALANQCQFNTLSNNSVTFPNQLNEAGGAGILAYGTGCGNNRITGNTIWTNTSYMYYGINDNDGLAFANNITNNYIYGAATAEVYKPLSSTEALNTQGYIAYTPTLTAATGTITSYTATGGYYQIGKMVYFTVTTTISSAGTGAGVLNVSLPFQNNGIYQGNVSGIDQTTNSSLIGQIDANLTIAKVVLYNNTTPITSGHILSISGFFQRI